MPIRNLTDNNPDGWNIGQLPTDRIALFGALPVPQRSCPMQAQIQALNAGCVISVQGTGIASTSIAANSTTEIAVTIPSAVIASTDFVLAACRAASQAGVGVVGMRNNGATTPGVAVNICNTTASAVTITASEVWTFVLARGLNTFSQAITPSAVAANTTVEQQFTIMGSGAAGTAIVNSAGQITGVKLTSGGSNYQIPPTVIFQETTAVTPSVLSGYMGQLPGQTSGFGGGGTAVINNGSVVGVQILSQGANYSSTTPPNVLFIGGGNQLSVGMAVFVNKPTSQAGLGVVNARVVANNIVGITYQNYTSSAITPTANETYQFYAANDMPPMSNIVQYGFVPGAVASVTSSSTYDYTITMTGATTISVNDIWPSGAMKISNSTFPSGLTTPMLRTSVTTAASVVLTFDNAAAAAVTGAYAGDIFAATCIKQSAQQPMALYLPYLTPTAVAPNTTAEQTFTVTGLVAGTAIAINKTSSPYPNLNVAGVRVSAANTLAITYANNSSATITPAAEIYLLANFPTPPPGSGSGNYAKQDVSQVLNEAVDFAGEFQLVGVLSGLIKGG